MDRDRLEQDAMKLLQRGQSEKALEKYMAILRHDTRDRRIRQKVAEIYLSLGRKPEASRHLMDLARSMTGAGQLRQAASVYKQLVDLKPDEHELRADYAKCLAELGRRNEARAIWEEAFRLVERRDPRAAIDYAEQVAKLSPGEVPPKVRVAELMENNRREEEAFERWLRLGQEARRFGRPDDQARFLERALKLNPDNMAALLDAAEARITQGEIRQGLAHLQHAYGLDSHDVRLLTLLGRGLQQLGQTGKARRVWIQAARRQAELGNRDAQVSALRHALECGDPDPRLQAELSRADAEAARQRIRLHEQDWAQPVTDAQVRVLVRARTQRDYGFPQLARETLEQAPDEVCDGVAWKALYAELLIALGDHTGGVSVMRSIVPPSDTARDHLTERLEVLGAVPLPSPSSPTLPAEPTDELVDDDDTDAGVAGPSPQEDEDSGPDPAALEAEADRLLDDGDTEGAIALYRQLLALTPSNSEILRKIGEAMSDAASRARAQRRQREDRSAPIALAIPEPELPQPELPQPDLPDPGDDLGGVDFGSAFGEVDPSALDSLDDMISDARALVEVGEFEEALDKLRGQDDLEALVVQAKAARALNRMDSAQGRLERAVQGGGEHHPAYIEALWELAGVYLARRKLGNAERILDEAALVDPTYRPVEMAARRRGIELLRQR